MSASEGNAGKVLVLELDRYFLRTIVTYLKDSGRRVLPCTSAASALERFRSAGGAIDLLIVDVAAVDGMEAALQLMSLTPELKILLMSEQPLHGWRIWDAALYCHLPSDSVRVLQRPFSALELLVYVDELIGSLPEAGTLVGTAGLA